MMNKKIKRATSGLLLTALMVGGAYAMLSTSKTGTKSNSITVGTISVVFDNQQSVIDLSESYPMTREYATANVAPYTFTVDNDGDIDVLYSIKAVSEDGNTLDPSYVDLILDDDKTLTLADSGLTNKRPLRAGESDSHSLLAYIEGLAKNEEVVGKTSRFHLELDAVQLNLADPITIANEYAAIEKSLIATSVTVGSETKNVEVYNITGETKDVLLQKLEESGLARANLIDAIVEVKGDEYDGINSTATFDVSSIASAGDRVVILHFNEETGQWEYIGTSKVDDNGLISGEFTSYSPVAFVVMDKMGNYVTTYESDIFYGAVMYATAEDGSIDTSTTVSYNWNQLKEMGKVTDTTVKYQGFRNNKALVSIDIPEGVTDLGIYAFDCATSLTSVTLPSTLKTIDKYALRATGLEEIIIPEGVTTINAEGLASNAKLTNVILPSTLETLGGQAFQGDTALTSIVLPEGLISIGGSAFWGCTNLLEVTIPSTVQSIGDGAFSYLWYEMKLSDIYYNGTIEQWNAITKASGWAAKAPSTLTIHCSDGNLDKQGNIIE